MAAGGPGGHAARRHAGRLAHRRGPAGPMVVVRGGDRRVHRRVGMAAARGPALMGGALWERLARVFGRGARERSEAERILLEADFGVEATEEILDRVSGAKDGDHDFRAALERAVIGALTPAAPSVAPGALARAPRSEEHTSELQSPIDISYAVFCLKKKTKTPQHHLHFRSLLYQNNK